MPRLREVRRDETDNELILKMYDRLFGEGVDPVDNPGTATGTPGNWWTVFALAPDVFEHAVIGFRLYANPERELSPILRELGQTRAGWLRGSQFVFSQHCKSCRSLGMSEEKIAAIPAWQTSDEFDDQERAVLAYTDALVADGGRVADGIFEKLKTFLSDKEILELTYITALYDMHAVITRALRLEYDDREEPVVEIAAPEGYQATDIGRATS